ncbi:flippase [Vibrio natriegens]|uniref:Flippase n=1 Tax=Vibrio natriegens NBRC 15636 = ATCC 14048 = DSM 759 TaxID=1219067 RepID=A0AAN1CUR0_VIBNA|nr:flippase [Vibrio natriegens]ALR16683.1 hypothetical protein PN96_12150 [Vibrio natriegens NBRC 15636 = ATCC 14048 = DSM 759]ANQ11451.1 hypothetical protein BA890_01180 [Vibrio natriegens NBRC 15636 = ATCC 14048 = DSM 759]EPM39017.1 hypothetical protein M272_18740 [Vibrio natriegens NBRC 15636 = ATCC 14048 = DSM 759]MDX6025782.1 flippase [Vibrio natriegens NBRC 15636 = ATCC 14048 = DSM 759]UUI11899.1 flippase [Vibrio natriegens]
MKVNNRFLKSNHISNSDRKSLVTNFGYLLFLRVVSYIFPLITIPYLARVIGVEGFGKIAFSAAIIVWFQTISDWGFNFTGARDIARNKDDVNKMSEIFSSILWARCLLAIVSFMILFLMIETVSYFSDYKLILLLTFLVIPGNILFPEWFFQAVEDMKYITYLSFISKVIFTLLIFIFVTNKEDYIYQPLFFGVGYIFVGIFSMIIIIRKYKLKILRPRYSRVIKSISDSKDVFINNIVPNLYNSFSHVLLGFYGGNGSNGILDAGMKVPNIVQIFVNMISRVFFPYLSRRIDGHELYEKINLIISFILSLTLYLLAEAIVGILFTSEFYEAKIIIEIMSISLFFLTMNSVYGTNYLIIIGRDKLLRNITFFVSAFGFCISFPLVFAYDYIGAAITIALTRSMLGLTVMIYAKKIKGKMEVLNVNCNS